MRYDEKYPSIPALVQHAARERGDSVFIVDDDESWSFQETELRMLQATKGAMALGIEPGDRVALSAPNSAQWIQIALGIMGAGAVLVPLNTRYKLHEVAHILTTSSASAVFTVGSFLGRDYVEMMRAASDGLPDFKGMITLDDIEAPGAVTFSRFIEAGSRISDKEALLRIARVGPDDLSDIMFTSGTTGAPKGVQLTHSQSLRAYGWLSENYTYSPADTFAIVPPFFHTFGYKAGWLGSLIQGTRIIPVRTFDATAMLEKIQKYSVSIMVGPPTIFIDLINHPDRTDYNLDSLRVTAVGAANVSTALVDNLHDVLGFERVYNAYGLTETTSLVSAFRPDDDPTLTVGTVGRPADDIEVVIGDDDGSVLGPGETGEIWVRGYNVMRGYWNDPDATAKVMTPDGYLRTGDIGNIDSNGFLRVTDRKKDMFIVGGFNAYPAEIEESLARLDNVMYAAVIGVPDPRMGEVGWAFVVPKPNTSLTEQEVEKFARENLANFKVPRRIVILDDLPRNSSLKVLKNVLREQVSAGTWQRQPS